MHVYPQTRGNGQTLTLPKNVGSGGKKWHYWQKKGTIAGHISYFVFFSSSFLAVFFFDCPTDKGSLCLFYLLMCSHL